MRSSIEQLLAKGCQNDEGMFFFPLVNLHACIVYTVWRAWHGMAPTFTVCDFMCMCICKCTCRFVPFVHFCVLSICTGIWCTTTRLFALIWLNANMHSLWCGWFAEVSAMASHKICQTRSTRGIAVEHVELQQLFCHWHQHPIGPHVLISFTVFFTVLYNPPGAEWRSWCPSNIATFSGGWSTNMVPKDPEVRSDAYLAILRSWCPPSTDDFTHTYDIEELKFWRAQRPGDRCWNAWPGNDWPVTSCGFLCWMRPFPSFSFIFHISFLINLPF